MVRLVYHVAGKTKKFKSYKKEHLKVINTKSNNRVILVNYLIA
ncbi:MAG: hypothetical protein U0354_14545 [Candidatus Sericytochromatia bacterium]